MSKIKEYYGDFFQEERFVTDDSYEDYLRMKENHEQQQMQEELQEQKDGADNQRTFQRSFISQRESFLNGKDDLPF